jgi:hypothetical protein
MIPDYAFIRNLVYTWNYVSSCELSSCLLKGPERTEMERHVLFTLPITEEGPLNHVMVTAGKILVEHYLLICWFK